MAINIDYSMAMVVVFCAAVSKNGETVSRHRGGDYRGIHGFFDVTSWVVNVGGAFSHNASPSWEPEVT